MIVFIDVKMCELVFLIFDSIKKINIKEYFWVLDEK